MDTLNVSMPRLTVEEEAVMHRLLMEYEQRLKQGSTRMDDLLEQVPVKLKKELTERMAVAKLIVRSRVGRF